MANKTSKLLIDVEPLIGNLGAQIKKIEGDLLDVEKKAKGIDIGGKIEGQVKDAINKIKELQQDYLKGLDKMSSGKLDVSAFEEFSKTIKGRLDAVETQITDLQSDFANLNSDMEKFKGGDNLAKQMETARQSFEEFKQETKEALAVLEQIQDVTNSSFKFKELKELGKTIEKIGNINFDPTKTVDKTRKSAKTLTNELDKMYKNYESLVEAGRNEKKGSPAFNRIQNQITNLLPQMELLIRQIAKAEKIDLNDIFDSKYEVGDTWLQNIARVVEGDAKALESSLVRQHKRIKEEMDAVGDVMAKGFAFKNGGIQIPVMLDRETINNTEDKLRELLEGLDQYSRANPVSITLKFRKFKGTEDEFKEYNKDLKNLKLAIDKTEDKGLKKQLQSIYSSVTSQYEKASKLSIKTNAPQVADDIVKSVDRIEKAIQKGKFTINPRIEITKEEKERVKKEISKIQDPFTIDITKSLKEMGDSLKGLLDTKDTDKWVNAFAEGLKSLDTQLKPLQELIDSFNKLSKTDKKTGKTPATTKDEINFLQTFINAVESLQLALDQYHNDIKSLDAAYINVEPDFDADSFVSAIENQITRPAQIPVTPILDGVGNIVVAMQDAIDGKAITVTPVVEIDPNNVKQTNNKKTGTKKTNTQNTKQDEKEVTEVVSKYANMTRDELYEQKKVAEGKLKRVTRKDTIEKWKRTLKEINDALKATGEKKSAQEIRDDMKRLKEMMDNADKTTTEAASKAKNKSRRKKTNDGTYRPEKTPEEQLQTMKQYMKELPKVVENSKNIFGAGMSGKFRTTLDILEHYTKASDAIRQGKDDIKYLEKYGLEVHPYDPKQRTKKDIADEIKKAQENKKLEQPSKDIIRLSELYAQTGELKHLKEISKLTNDNEFDAKTKKIIHDAINVELARVSNEIKAEADKADGFEALKKDIEKNEYSVEDKAKKFLEYQKKSGNTTHQVGELSTDMVEQTQLAMAYNKLSEATEKNTEKTKENKKAHEDNNKTKSQSKKDAKATTEADTQATSENTQEVNKNTNAIKANKQWQEKRKKIYDEVKNQFKNQDVNINKLSKEDKEKLLDDVTTLSREKRWTAKTSADEFYKRAKALKEEQDAAKKARLEEQKLAEAKDKQRVHDDLARMRGETHIKKEEKPSLISLQKSLEENIAYLKSEYGWNGKDSSLDKLSTVGNGVKASIKEYQQSRDRLNNAIADASQKDKDALQKYIDEKNKQTESVKNKQKTELEKYVDSFHQQGNSTEDVIKIYEGLSKYRDAIDKKIKKGETELTGVLTKTDQLMDSVAQSLMKSGYNLDKKSKQWKRKDEKIRPTEASFEREFEKWKQEISDRSGFKLNKKSEKDVLAKYIEKYQWYQKSGGARSITELSDDIKTQDKLRKEYEKTTGAIKENTKAKKENSTTTYEELISDIKTENEEIAKGNKLFKERLAYLDSNGNVVKETIGKYDEVGVRAPFGLKHGKIIHTHPDDQNYGGHASIDDLFTWGEDAKRGFIDEAELLWRNKTIKFDFSKMTQEGIDKFVENYSHIMQAIVAHFGEEIDGDPGYYKIPDNISDSVNAYIYALTEPLIKSLGGNIISDLDISKIDNNVLNGIGNLYNQIIALVDSNISNELKEKKFNQLRTDYRKTPNETPDLSDNGKKQGESYTEGIESTKPDAEKAGADLANAANEGTAKAQDSNSPSKVAEKLGEYWGEGYAEGILNTQAKVKNAVRALVETGKLTTEDLIKDSKDKDSDTKTDSKNALDEIDAGKNITRMGNDFVKHIQNVDSIKNYEKNLNRFFKDRQDSLTRRVTKAEKEAIANAVKLSKDNDEFGGDSLKLLEEAIPKTIANPKEISTAKGQLTKLFNELENGEDFSPEQLDKFDERFAKWSNKLSGLGVDIADFTNRYSSIRLQYGESVDESLGKVKETIEEDSKVIETAEEKLATYLQFLVSRGKELLGDDVVDMVRQTRIKETKQGQFKAISYKVTGKSGSVTLDPYGQEVATRSQKFDDYTRHQQTVKTLVKEMDGYLSSVLNKEIQIGKARADGNTELADSLETQVKRDIELYEQNKNRLKELGEEKVLQEQIIKESVSRKKQEDEINNTIASRNDKAKKEALKQQQKDDEQALKYHLLAMDREKEAEENAYQDKIARRKEWLKQAQKETAERAKAAEKAAQEAEANSFENRWNKSLEEINKNQRKNLSKTFQSIFDNSVGVKQGDLFAAYHDKQGNWIGALADEALELNSRYDVWIGKYDEIIAAQKEVDRLTKLSESAPQTYANELAKATDEVSRLKGELRDIAQTNLLDSLTDEQQTNVLNKEKILDAIEMSRDARKESQDKKDFDKEQKLLYDQLGEKVKEYLNLRQQIAQGKGLEGDIQKVEELTNDIEKMNNTIKDNGFFNGDLETKAMNGMDTIDEEVRRIEEGVTRKEQEVRSKVYERLSGKLQSAQYDIGFELKNGGHTAKFNEELKEIQSELIAINNIKIDVVTQQDITDAQDLLERVRQIRKEGKLTSNKQANENSLQKNLAQVNSMLSGNTKLAFKRTDVYKELMRLQTLFKSFDTSRPQAELAELTTRLLQTKAKFDALANSVKGQNLFQTFLERIHGTTAQLVAQYLSWMDIIRYARTAINSIVELDTALVDLRKTTKMSATELDQFYFTSNEIAKQLGVTTSEVISQAAAWSRFNKIDPLYGNI